MIELLVYTFILVLLLSAIMYALIAISGLYRSIKSATVIKAAAQVTLERMVRDIRAASSVDIPNSVFNASPGQLTLNAFDDADATTTTRFNLVGDIPHVAEDGVDQGPLASDAVRVTSLIFRPIASAKSSGIKIEMQIESGSGKDYRAETFYSTAVLRGSYPVQ